MPETQLPVMISQQTQLPYTYPMVTDLFDVVPLPFTQDYAAPAGTVVAPNSLRLVHKFGGTLADFPSNPHTFSIPRQSPQDAKAFVNAMQATILWKEQMIKHGRAIILIDSTHNSVNNLCLSDGRKVSLYTIIIHDPTSGKGLPVCWAFTSRASTWLWSTTGMIPCAIMSDCNRAIKKAVLRTYCDSGVWAPKHYWCTFHIMKAFKARSIQDLSSRAKEAIGEFKSVIYGDDPEDLLSQFYGTVAIQANLLASLRVANKEDTDEDSKADCDIPVITPQKRKQAGNKDLSSLPNCPMPAPATNSPK
ncbi:hypothetical protein PCANC_00036 [Puccinia coronata f. sp. avenae]|uniref:MULE transposase domain-containing protein n=1 Tax=Puccinia coronata f. sp. avenae TaxID=200324 RepID=A0A2N5W8Q5_9BASI|nr:hypothetical protein PCANC_00036 [Puccinia coronata f. sp. avenae]